MGQKTAMQADRELDITSDVCPMTFVRTKIALEGMAVGQVLRVVLRGEEPLANVPRALLDHGQEVLAVRPLADGCHELWVRRRR